MFCPKCGSLLRPKKSGNRIVKYCSCGYTSKDSSDEGLLIKEKSNLEKRDEIVVVDRVVEILPKINEECGKCGNNEVYYWTIQTRAGDEAETRFFKCTKCDHVWRSYS